MRADPGLWVHALPEPSVTGRGWLQHAIAIHLTESERNRTVEDWRNRFLICWTKLHLPDRTPNIDQAPQSPREGAQVLTHINNIQDHHECQFPNPKVGGGVPNSANLWKKNRRERKRGESRYRKMSTPSAEDLGKVQIVLDFLKGTFPGRFC